MQRQPALTLLRWIAVLPAAAAGAFFLKLAGGLIGQAVRQALGATSESNITFSLQLLVYAATAAAFVLTGTYTAPTERRVVASVLATVSVLLSLLTHIVSQQHPGSTNYLHLAAEACGAVVGVACVVYRENRTRTRGAAVIETDQ
jgi:hypothetical protein